MPARLVTYPGVDVKLKKLIFGAATFVPGFYGRHAKGTGGTNSARYCYSIWLRHLVMARQNGLNTWPKTVAELGPGDSIGIGLAALISGCEKYYAFDVVEHAESERNLSIFDELVGLYRNRAPIPGNDEWPRVIPRLEDHVFPSDILDDDRMNTALDNTRLERIRNSVRDHRLEDSMIEYMAPWYEAGVLKPNSVDMIYSQAVLEHVDDLKTAYSTMSTWLNPTGFLSHTIDFGSHGFSDEWNGNWAYSDWIWKLIRGKRPYLLNREPCSTHLKMIEDEGFELVCNVRSKSESRLSAIQLAPRFRSISPDDLVTNGVFVQAVKKTV